MKKKKSLVWQNCSEVSLNDRINEWIQSCSLQDLLVILEGEMGAGKSAFARSLFSLIAPEAKTQGSPTFPLVQTYRASKERGSFPIYHIDLYRLKNEAELYDSGIESQVEEAGSLVLVEWASLFESFYQYWTSQNLKRRKTVWKIEIEGSGQSRTYRLSEC